MPGSSSPVAESASARPAPWLRPFVEGYRGYRMTGFEPGLHHGAPSRHMTFIVDTGTGIDVVAQTDPRQSPHRYGAVVGGLQDTSALIAHDGTQEGVAIELTPLGSRVLFGVPARELWNVSAELDDLVGGVAHELRERLVATIGWRARFAVCDEILTRLADADAIHAVAPELAVAWRALVASLGLVPVTAVAAETGWSRQHLGRRFRDEFGLAPKTAARIMRFERARRMLLSTPSYVSIAQVAATCGFYDQAHLNREFVTLTGRTPGQLVAEEVPFVQDGDGPAG